MRKKRIRKTTLTDEVLMAIENFLEVTVEQGEETTNEDIHTFVEDIGYNCDNCDIDEYLETSDLWQLARDNNEGMRILMLDIETAPTTAYVWGLFKQNIYIDSIIKPGRMICWAAKWHKKEDITFQSEHKDPVAMLTHMWNLLNEADVVVHYNGTKFDIPHINREFIKAGMAPPSPYKQVDLCRVVKGQFRFPSNKLDWISRELEIGQKLEHEGIELWIKCMASDNEAWKTMEAYNRQDVVLLEDVYNKMLPWIKSHPNRSVYSNKGDRPVCRNCGSDNVKRDKVERTNMRVYPRYVCKDCGSWSRLNKTLKQVNRGLTY